jgi:hypothetical protein
MYQLTRLLAETMPPLYKLFDRLEVDPRFVKLCFLEQISVKLSAGEPHNLSGSGSRLTI